MSTVEFRGFGWRHAGRKAWAVRHLDLRIEHGERVLLAGASGAGKSTLLAALAGLLAEDSGEQEGEVLIDGRPARQARAETGIVFQDPQTQLVMSRAGDDVAFGLENRAVPRDEIWPRVDAALNAVGFPYDRDRNTAALSGGEAQRLAIAGVIALRPGLLLLDEPTANLDPDGAQLVRTAIAKVIQDLDATLLLVEHRVDEALPLVDRTITLGADADAVWTPGAALPSRRAVTAPGEALLSAESLWLPHNDKTVHEVVLQGQALAVEGPNGAGKTTLALLLGGLTKPARGRVAATPTLAGRDAARPPHRWRASRLAARIGSVFQNPEHQFVTDTVQAELALSGAEPATVATLLERLRLHHLARANPFTLSGGEQRRLSVATALAAAPQVLILDEPTFGQDLRTWRELVTLLADLRDEGRALVLVTHDAQLVEAIADRRLKLTR
ncbi:ATP-binding cassette domain-containing protein [Dactylosporangium vinaceum]|uniref:ABC transporter ATP-binding protein n=1 Tax=Dactylosporangium vinaceum TaxID=53362 RepID=A0ABV5M7K1_9ACTN|nr:ABC transporter ATP-binding protein [Dactylosporangium vinaceum]UAC02331.1 ATP-binding cassette domain-containing protein [Dactylosporangium vinaceum]